MALDMLRVLQREPETLEIVIEELSSAVGGDRHLVAQLERVQAILQDPRQLDQRARALTESLATLAAGTILRAHAPAFVADAFIATRLAGGARQSYGQGLEQADLRAIVDRALPM
jgi:putative acyl-CoA dehydrogenase